MSKNELEIICRRDKLMKSQATHVVVGITYGLEAFCVFSPQQQKQKLPKTRTDDETAFEGIQNYARLFADRLMDDVDHLEPDQDQEGDEEDIVSSLYRLAMYSEWIQVEGGGQNWTSMAVGEQYEACRTILSRRVNKDDPTESITP